MNPGVFVTFRLPPELEGLRAAPYQLHLGEGRAPEMPDELKALLEETK